jgi:hypothetical protein
MSNRTRRTRLAAGVAGVVSAVLVTLTGGQAAAAQAAAPSHRAVDPATVLKAAKIAYDAYKMLTGGGLSVEDATQQIINAINGAKTEIIAHIDQIAVTQVRACAHHAVIDLVDLPRMSPVTREAFARDTTACVTLAAAQISALQDEAAIDELGFAVNAVGPIALLARARLGWDTGGLRTALINTNNQVMAKLTVSCHANPLWGDAPPGGNVEVVLRCTVYPGKVGVDFIIVPGLRPGRPLPPFDYTAAKAEAYRTTSYPVAQAALARL